MQSYDAGVVRVYTLLVRHVRLTFAAAHFAMVARLGATTQTCLVETQK